MPRQKTEKVRQVASVGVEGVGRGATLVGQPIAPLGGGGRDGGLGDKGKRLWLITAGRRYLVGASHIQWYSLWPADSTRMLYAKGC